MVAWRTRNIYRNYTSEEVLQIFGEVHRLISFIDFEVGEGLEITGEMTIYEWRLYHNLLPGRKLYQDFNRIFKVNLPNEMWTKAVEPERKKTVWDLCVFIAQHAKKELVCPIRLSGRDCLNAAVFLTLKKNLSERGLDAEDIRPSSSLRSLLNDRTYPHVLDEVILTGARPFESLELKLRSNISFWRKINLFARDRYYLDTGSIRTFGDLARKIAEGLPKDA